MTVRVLRGVRVPGSTALAVVLLLVLAGPGSTATPSAGTSSAVQAAHSAGSVGSWSHSYTEAGTSGRTVAWTIRSEVSTSHLALGSTESVAFDITSVVEITTPNPACTNSVGSSEYDTHPNPLISAGWLVWPAEPLTPPWMNGEEILPQSSQTTDGDVFTSASECSTYFRETTTQVGVLVGLGSLDSDPSTPAIDGGCWTPSAWNARLSGAPSGYQGGSFATVTVGDAGCEPPQTADVSVTMTVQPEVRKDALMLYEITVTNNGPDFADDVLTDLTLPPFVHFQEASTTAGYCIEDTPRCFMTGLNFGEQAVVTVRARSPILPPREMVSTVEVQSATLDPDGSDNTASAITQLIDSVCQRTPVQAAAAFDAELPEDYLKFDIAFTWCGGGGEPIEIDPASISVIATTDLATFETLLAQVGVSFETTDRARATDVTANSFVAQGTFNVCINPTEMLALIGGPAVRALVRNWSRLPLMLRTSTLTNLIRAIAGYVPQAGFLPGFPADFRRLLIKHLETHVTTSFNALVANGFGTFCVPFWEPVVPVTVNDAGVQAASVGSDPAGSIVRVRINDLLG